MTTNSIQQQALFTPPETTAPASIPSPVFAPRPGWGGILGSWIGAIFTSRATPLFLALLAVIIIANFTLNRNIPLAQQKTNKTFETMATPPGRIVPANSITIVSVTAKSGQGLTHLARQAIAQYLAQNSTVTLSPEQNVYAEDFLRRRADVSGMLQPGQAVDFTAEDIDMAVTKARALEAWQLENLKKYTKPNSVTGEL